MSEQQRCTCGADMEPQWVCEQCGERRALEADGHHGGAPNDDISEECPTCGAWVADGEAHVCREARDAEPVAIVCNIDYDEACGNGAVSVPADSAEEADRLLNALRAMCAGPVMVIPAGTRRPPIDRAALRERIASRMALTADASWRPVTRMRSTQDQRGVVLAYRLAADPRPDRRRA